MADKCNHTKLSKACKIVYIRPKNQPAKPLTIPSSDYSEQNFPGRWLAPLFLSLAFFVAVPVSLCAQDKPQPSPPSNASPANPPPSNPKPLGGGTAGAGAPVDSGTYKIGPNDILYIRIWGENEFSGPVAVHQDGKFTLPLVGDLEAGGKTPVEVQEIVATALKKLVVKPLVTVTVQEVGSKRYYLDGQVNHPGEYALITPTTVLEAISKAGGLAEFANQKKIYILRGSKRIPFNYKDVLRGKNMAQNIKLQPDDHVVAP